MFSTVIFVRQTRILPNRKRVFQMKMLTWLALIA